MASDEKSISKSTPSTAATPTPIATPTFPLERLSSATTMTNANTVSNIRKSIETPSDKSEFTGENKRGSKVEDEDDVKGVDVEGGKIDERAGDTRITAPDDGEYPEGGLRAWLVVIGCALLTCSTFGFVNAWGVFQEYYSQTLLSNQSHSNIAWIGSVQYALVLMPGSISGRLFDIGYFRETMIPATCLLVLSTFLVGECKRYWQFMLCQGISVGTSSGFLFGPTLAVTSNYFHRRRPFVFGLVAVGSSVGGTLLPIVTRNLIPKIGFPWTMRVLGFFMLLTTSTANLLIRRRLPPVNIKGGLFNFPAFKSPHFALYYLSSTFGFFGMFTALTYLDTAAVEVAKINGDLAFYLISIANACSGIGRLGSGALSGRYGPINVLGFFMVLAALMTYVWPYALSVGSLITVSVFYGVASGAFIGVVATPLTHPKFGVQGDMGRRTGMLFTLSGIGALCGPPISGAIHDATGGYKAVGAYAGSILMMSLILMISAKWVATGTPWGKF